MNRLAIRPILLSILALALPLFAWAAEPPALPLPAPDPKQPLQFDLFIGPLSKEDAAKHKALLEKNYKTGFGHLPGQPFMFGFTLAEGKPSKPFSRLFSYYYEPAKYMDEVPDVGHCAYGSWAHSGGPALQHRDEFHAFTVERQGDTLRGSCHFTATQTAEMKTELKMTWTAKIVGGTQIEGQAAVCWGEMVVTRPLTGIVRQGLADLIDPLNCIYQFTDARENLWMVVQVKDGKPVLTHGYIRRSDGVQLRKVDASSMRIVRADHGVNGWKADLDGSVAMEGAKPTVLSLQGVKIGVNGVGWGGNGVKVRAYSPADPVARGWSELVPALFAQAPVPATLADRAKQQSVDLPAMPPPSPAAKYHFKVRCDAKEPSRHIYAPWLDFEAVAGAAQYRFSVREFKREFTAPTPRASLVPIWQDFPLESPTKDSRCLVSCIALDAAGKPVGEPQTRSVVRKPFYGAHGAVGATLPLPLAEEAALRAARVGTQRQLGLAPLWERLAAQGIKLETSGFDRMPNLWLALAVGGRPGYERDLALAVAPHSPRWYDMRLPGCPMGIPWSYGNRYWFAPMDWMPNRLDSYELLRDPPTGGVNRYESALTPSTPEMLRQMLQNLTRLQQPSGSFCGATVYHRFPVFSAFGSIFGGSCLDFNSASFLNMAGRLRRGYGCTGEALAMELKGQHWLDRNTLRTGWWENQEQQGSPADYSGIAPPSLHRYLNYQIEYALPQISDLDLAETLARLAEDCFFAWAVEPRTSGRQGCGTGDSMTSLARLSLLLHQRTGDPLYLAKADALFSQRLREVDPVWGLTSLMLSYHGGASHWDPLEALRYLDLRRQIAAKPPSTTPADPADAHLVLTLDRLLDRAERAVVHLATRGGTVQRAFALTPSRQPIDIDFTQPGRLHVHADTPLHHAVEAQGLKIGPRGASGQLTLRLAGEPKPLTVTVALTPDYRVLRGTWTAAGETGRAALEIRPDAVAKPRRAHVEMCQAVAGGEPWQNWAAGMWNLKPDGAVSGAWFGNNNAGWSAEVKESSLKLTAGQMEASLKVEVRWDGVVEGGELTKKLGKQGAPDPGGLLAKEWKEGRRAWLADWELAGAARCAGYQAGFSPPPGYAVGNKLTYQTSHQTVKAGTYTYRFQGQRLGDVLAGAASVTKPDGATAETKFLGGIE